jgi:holo-[acyl-carrier protein] synthase
VNILSGIDIVRIERLEQVNPAIRRRFFDRVFNDDEKEYIRDVNERAAGIFAAKEAVSKVLGTGIGRVSWQDIHIHHEMSGKPTVILYNTAKDVSGYQGISAWSVSISHSRDNAVAVAVALSDRDVLIET